MLPLGNKEEGKWKPSFTDNKRINETKTLTILVISAQFEHIPVLVSKTPFSKIFCHEKGQRFRIVKKKKKSTTSFAILKNCNAGKRMLSSLGWG